MQVCLVKNLGKSVLDRENSFSLWYYVTFCKFSQIPQTEKNFLIKMQTFKVCMYFKLYFEMDCPIKSYVFIFQLFLKYSEWDFLCLCHSRHLNSSCKYIYFVHLLLRYAAECDNCKFVICIKILFAYQNFVSHGLEAFNKPVDNISHIFMHLPEPHLCIFAS